MSRPMMSKIFNFILNLEKPKNKVWVADSVKKEGAVTGVGVK